jgi:hypothetical protein
VFVVALAELHGTLDAEAAALATDLRLTPYETRLLLAAGLPAVVKTTDDKALALDLLARIRARGHGAVACDGSAVVPSNAMTRMHRFQLGEGEITLADRPEERLPFDDVLALIAAAHRRHANTTTTTHETKFSMQRAIWTGGVAFTKTFSTQAHALTDEREGVLYLFRRSGATPWILHEHGTSWAGLPVVAATESENFRAAMALLRERAPGAVFDGRLVARKAPERTSLSGGGDNSTIRSSNEASVDLLAHLVALWISRGAYR